MKILLVVPDTNLGGGITSSVVNFANEVSSRGNDVYFLDMSSQIANKNLLYSNIKIVDLHGKSANWRIQADDMKKTRGFARIKIALLGLIKKLTIKSGVWYRLIFSKIKDFGVFDVAIAYRQCDSCYSFVLHKVDAEKKIAFVHGELNFMGDISSWQKHMTHFDKIAYVSNAVREQFVTAYPELAQNACTIYNMFNVKKIKYLAKEKPAIEFDKSVKNIVTVARIDNAFKQIHWIVEICKRLRQRSKIPFNWYVIGYGPDYDNMVELAKKYNVEDILFFIGYQDNPYSLMRQCDFTVLTSKSEAYPMAVIESFVVQKPIVVAEFPSIFEMMQNGKQGLIAKQSQESIENAILSMLENKNGVFVNSNIFLKQNLISNRLPYEQFLNCIGE